MPEQKIRLQSGDGENFDVDLDVVKVCLPFFLSSRLPNVCLEDEKTLSVLIHGHFLALWDGQKYAGWLGHRRGRAESKWRNSLAHGDGRDFEKGPWLIPALDWLIGGDLFVRIVNGLIAWLIDRFLDWSIDWLIDFGLMRSISLS